MATGQEELNLPEPWHLEMAMLDAETAGLKFEIALLGLQAISLEYRTAGREIRHRYYEAWQLADNILANYPR